MDNQNSTCQNLCRACPHRNLSFEQSCTQKKEWLQNALGPWKSLIQDVQSIKTKRWHYRNKACLKTSYDEFWKIGLNHFDEIIEIPDCPIHSININQFVKKLKAILPPYSQFPLHYLHIARAQITFIIKSKKRPSLDFLKPLYEELTDLEFEGVWLHLNPACGMNVFNGKNWELLWGKERSQDNQGLFYGPASFSQLIPELHHESLEVCDHFFDLNSKSRFVDLYSGNGSSIMQWQKKGAQILGIEISGEAIACAKINAPQVQLLRGLAKDRLPQIEQFISSNSYTLYANPPRTGLEKEVLEWLDRNPPQKMAYLSCSAGTLKRDLETLTRNLEIENIIPYDFFPGTRHIETLVLLKEKTMNKENNTQKTCPKCGKNFICTHDEKCWCMALTLSPENLKRLKKEYNDCLCEDCLKTYATKS